MVSSLRSAAMQPSTNVRAMSERMENQKYTISRREPSKLTEKNLINSTSVGQVRTNLLETFEKMSTDDECILAQCKHDYLIDWIIKHIHKLNKLRVVHSKCPIEIRSHSDSFCLKQLPIHISECCDEYQRYVNDE